MMSETTQGRCFCGAVEIAVSGEPKVMGFCHCTSCRSWGAAPVNAFTLWDPQTVKVIRGEDKLATYNKTEASFRKFCKTCGGHVMTDHPKIGLIDVYAATIPDLSFQPQVHIHYGEKVLSIPDGLPKFNDVPAEFGGSGDKLPE
jgi:hypothetical protein